ncbi:MAG: choline ABC transporter ATP-binding protein, partial [Cypionkella sp.]
RIALMEGGRIVQCGTPQEIIANPVDEYVEDFVAHMNPLNVLQAADVMSTDTSRSSEIEVAADTPVAQVIDMLAMGRPCVMVRDAAGTMIGSISSLEILAALKTKPPRPGKASAH